MTESMRTKIYQQWQQKQTSLCYIHSRKCSLLISRHTTLRYTVERVSSAGDNFREFRVSVAIRECFRRASERGALGSQKFAKVFSAKIYFQAIR